MAQTKSKLTGAQQIATMRHLNQAAAAWLLNVNGRVLRDQPNIPRHADGGYDARELLHWAKSRQPEPTLTDEEAEKRLTICEHFEEVPGLAVPAITDFLDHLQDKHGDAGLAMFARDLLEHCRQFAEPETPEPTLAQLRAEIESRMAQDRKQRLRAQLKTCVVCEKCGRLRCGSKWVKRQPLAGYAVLNDVCPSCES